MTSVPAQVSEAAPEKPKRSALNQLTRTLLRKYDCGVRPVYDWTSVTRVYVDLILLSVLDVVTHITLSQSGGGRLLLTESTFVSTGREDSEHHHQHLEQTGDPTLLQILQTLLSSLSSSEAKCSIFTCWCLQVWTDEFLVWDPEEFDGLNEISLSSDAVWTPDVIVAEL